MGRWERAPVLLSADEVRVEYQPIDLSDFSIFWKSRMMVISVFRARHFLIYILSKDIYCQFYTAHK
jgi:hypothetical protein